jgi:hypothetical protein
MRTMYNRQQASPAKLAPEVEFLSQGLYSLRRVRIEDIEGRIFALHGPDGPIAYFADIMNAIAALDERTAK